MDITTGITGDLAYDLRQRYAKIVGDQLEEVTYARKTRNYPDWFKALEDLYTITEYKFNLSDEEKKELKKDNSKFELKNYTKLKEELVVIANKHTETWGGSIKDPEEIAKIEKALRNIEEWILFKMNEANMFGSKRETEGLV
jgi:hypothetical protein|tara:strand:- start:6048 stop:6473 length:426 start_codon:yes stop_codon:yes gene_type:complete